jgi:chromosome segregation ATPase
MLEDLQSEMIDDRAIEQGLFDKYNCWYDTVMSSKKQSMAEATDRVEALNSYIDDIESGRIEFSSEGAEATADVQELNNEIEKMDQRREKEHDDYKAAKEEMETAIGGLESALEELEDGTEGSLLDMSHKPGLKQAADLAAAVLPQKDAALLAEVVKTGKLSKPDYDKLNKKNVHGQKYKMRSGKIQELISDMLKTFKDNLDEANTKEDETKSTYDKLKATKEDQLESAEDALSAMGGETASRDEAKSEANNEVDTLEDQIKDDKKIVEDTTTDFERNRDLWKERKKLMTLEISAVSNALNILKSDEARDAMSTAFDDKKVFNPAATASFLQLGSSKKNVTVVKRNGTNMSSSKVNSTGAANGKKKKMALHAAAHALKGALKAVAGTNKAAEHKKTIRKLVDMLRAKAREGGDFDVVHKILNKQKKDLNVEAEADIEKKEECEELLVEKTESAQSSSNFIDEKSRYINRTEYEVADLWDVVNKTVDEIMEIEWELNDATVERDDYHNAFLKEKAGLEAAIGFIEQAKKALDKFYEDNSLGAHAALVQTHHARRLQKPKKAAALVRLKVSTKKAANPDMIVEAGKDPPPPPAISVGNYEGNEGNGGIQEIMSDIKGDVQHDLDKLKENEGNSKSDYEQLKSDLENAVSNKMAFKGEKETEIADKLTDISDANGEKMSEKTVLDFAVSNLQTL